MIDRWLEELARALRRLGKRPRRAAAGVLSLTVGIAAATSAFTVVDAVLLEPLPVERQDELVVLWQRSEARDFDHVPFLPSAFEAIERADGIFERVAAFETVGARPALAESVGGGHPIAHVRVAGDFFGTLGARAALGRVLGPDDDIVGAEASVVLGHDYWTRELGADPSAIGSRLRYNGVSYTVVGVASEGFDFPEGTDVWATLRGSYPDWGERRPTGIELDIVGRLSPARTLESASAAIDRILAGSEPDGRTTDFETTGTSFVEAVVGSLGPTLRVTLLVGLALLLVSVANATLLFLASAGAAIRDGALRRALGASGSDVVAPLLADAGLHASLAVLVGLALSAVVVQGLVPLAPADFARFDQVGLGARAGLFAIAVGVVSALLSAGLAGAWVLRRSPREVLTVGGRASTGSADTLRGSLAVSQVAMAVLAAVGAGLLWQTVRNLEGLDRGFDPENLFVVSLTLPFSSFEPPPGYSDALTRISDALAARPEIEAVSPTINAPLSVRGGLDFVPRLEGQTDEEARDNPFLGLDAVLPRYFSVAGTEVLLGRGPGAEDGPDDPPTVVVNESAARLLWPGEPAVGRRINIGGISRNEWRTVVGVVEDHRFRSFPEVRPAVYLPLAQYERLAPARLLVRTAPDGELSRAIAQSVIDAELPGVDVLTIGSMSDLMRRPLRRPRFAAAVLASFAAVTLLLAVVGVHGVFSLLVMERRRDIGVRIALGAEAIDVARFVVSRILLVGALGAAVGVLASLGLGGLLESLVFGVSSGDPRILAVAAAGVVGLGLLAGLLPTVRAIRTDPVEALRAD